MRPSPAAERGRTWGALSRPRMIPYISPYPACEVVRRSCVGASEGVATLPIITSATPERRAAWGGVREQTGVRRILCLKLDHIGDVLIAAPALMLLRRSFLQAHITLVCGPWNVGLVRRLRVADAIVPVEIFSQNSVLDRAPDARLKRRAAAVSHLQALELGPFDLAIDMRRDDDTRELLKLFTARIYAGFGDLDTFGYLDVALPSQRPAQDHGPARLHLRPEDLDNGMGHRLGERGLHLTARRGRIDLELSTDQVWPPTDEGVPDTRLLGAALFRIDVRPGCEPGREAAHVAARDTEVSRERMVFGPGWLDWEPWGRWSSTASAPLTLDFTTSGAEIELVARVQGHTAASHPAATVRVAAGGAAAAHTFRSGEEPVSLRLACRADLSPPTASSTPCLMRPGRYQGALRVHLPEGADWTPLTLTVRGGRLGQVSARLVTPSKVSERGELNFPFGLEHLDAAEPMVVEVGFETLSGNPDMAIVSVELECVQARTLRLPVAHMEAQLLDLAAMVAQRFSPTLVVPGDEVARNLSQAIEGSTASEAVAKIRARRGGRRVLGLKLPDRRILGVAIGANKETKHWPQGYFLELCQRLLERRDVHVALIGGPKEAPEVQALVDQLGALDRVLDLCACCRIEDLGEVLAELDGFIGLDTGTTHFAGRVGVKTLALFGAAHDPVEWGPVGARSAWAAVDTPCRSCSKSELVECDFGLQCMVALKPEDVWPMVKRQFL